MKKLSYVEPDYYSD